MVDVWAVTTAVATAVAAIAAAVSGYFAYQQGSDTRHVADVQAVAALSSQASDLYGRFKSAGIDDVPRLTSHLYLMWAYKDRGIVSDQYYVLQARTWCDLTRASSDKLKIYWRDPAFQHTYAGSPEFLHLIDALTDTSPTAPKECL